MNVQAEAFTFGPDGRLRSLADADGPSRRSAQLMSTQVGITQSEARLIAQCARVKFERFVLEGKRVAEGSAWKTGVLHAADAGDIEPHKAFAQI